MEIRPNNAKTAQAMQTALQLHQAGKLAEAQVIYRQVLSVDPNHIDALHLLGVLAHQTGNLDAAVELIGRATRLKPDWAEALNSLGNVLRAKGLLNEAVAAYRQVIRLKPNAAEVHNNLGVALNDQGMMDEAIAAYRDALRLDDQIADIHNNLGNALRAKGLLDEAIASCRNALRLRPDFAEAYNNLANALRARGLPDEAIAAYHQAIRLRPDIPDVHNNLGNVLRDAGQLDASINALRRSIQLRPEHAEAHNDLGNALSDKGLLNEAVSAYRQAIQLKPDFYKARNNLGVALADQGLFDEATAVYRQILERTPEVAETHLNLARNLLLKACLDEGWAEYEWRWRCKDFCPPRREFVEPLWDGGALNGQTILLHAEQGFGDTIQFVRYAPMVAARGGKVVLECQPQLLRLLQGLPGVEQVVVQNQALPHFDLHCPLLSLALLFRTGLETIPSTIPYLKVDARLSEQWASRLCLSGELRVGIVWAGSPGHNNDRNRTMPLSCFGPLTKIPGVRFCSLQKGEASREAPTLPEGMELINFTEDLNDFADTAALVANLDLVIAVDTAVAHLAGALGKRVWVLLPYVPDWRWMLEREDSPWYPTMRLFRQKNPGGWEEVIDRVAHALSHYSKVSQKSAENRQGT